jgi:putative FmdB family regulatory protein
MPFYEYECQACKYYTEVMQKITDAPLVKCPSCGKRALRKLVSAPVFRLKGAGWYETDFKSDQETKRNLLGEKEEAPAQAKAEAKDTKDGKDVKETNKESKGAKDAKPEAKEPKQTKAAEPKPVAASGARRSVSLPAKPARARRTSGAKTKSSRQRRR